MFHPWRRLRDLDIELTWSVMPDRLGETDGHARIRLHPHQSQVQRRCTLAHELAHIELGHTTPSDPAQERAADALAARWLVDVPDLVAAVRWSSSLEELADELWVDVATLRARLATLSADEAEQVTEALGPESL